jgi:CRISPR-associated protein Cas1
MRDYYIFKSGRVSRKDNSVMFEYSEDGQDKRVPIPVNDIDVLYLFGEVDLNTKLLNFFSQSNVMVHFFNYYGFYTGTFYPREFLNSGDVVVRQVSSYLKKSERLELAKQFVKGAAYGTIQNLKRYREKATEELEKVQAYYTDIDKQSTIPQIMGLEGNIKEIYYAAFPKIITQDIEFTKRVKNPPDNMINSLISFVNGMIYTEVLREIYKTQLNPTISYLHEPGYRRFSLSLDIAEIFKPIYGDRVIFSLLNNHELQKKHFDKDMNYAYLMEEGRKIVVKAIDDKLNTTIMHKQLKQRVSYRRIIRLELYKLVKHILSENKYESFRIWW